MKKISLLLFVFLICFSSMASASTPNDFTKLNKDEIIAVEEMQALLQQSQEKVVTLLESQEYTEIEQLPESKKLKELSEKYPKAYANFLNNSFPNVSALSSESSSINIELGDNERKITVLDNGFILESLSSTNEVSQISNITISPFNSCVSSQSLTNQHKIYGPHLVATMKLITSFDYNFCGSTLSYTDVDHALDTIFPMNRIDATSKVVTNTSTSIKTSGNYVMDDGFAPGIPLLTHTWLLETSIDRYGRATHTAKEL